MRFIFQTNLALVLLVFTFHSYAITPETSYSFGIGPQQATSDVAKRWTPIIQYLSEKSGVTLQFRTAKDIPTYQQQMRDGTFDLAFTNPYHYTVFHKAAGYTAFAKEKNGKLTGVIVVKKDGPIQDVSQLDGKTVAFAAATAIAATWLPLNYLKEKSVSVIPQYVTSMDSVYRSVAKGLFLAGGGETNSLSGSSPEVRDQLRILWTAEPLPPITFCYHPRVPKEVVMKIQKAMEDLTETPKGRSLLKDINFNGIEAAEDHDYDVLRKLNIQPVIGK